MAATGHSLFDVFHRQYPRLPYTGWTYPQFQFYVWKSESLMDRVLGKVLDHVPGAIASVIDRKAGKKFEGRLRKLLNG